MTTAEIIGSGCALLTVFGTVFVWAIRSAMAPVKISIDNNTQVIERITGKLDQHDETLDDHGARIVRIETKHSMKHPGE